jgi:hypothetical protein
MGLMGIERVYFIGAGFSAAVGYPTGGQLVARLWDYLNGRDVPGVPVAENTVANRGLGRASLRNTRSSIDALLRRYLGTSAQNPSLNVVEFFTIAHLMTELGQNPRHPRRQPRCRSSSVPDSRTTSATPSPSSGSLPAHSPPPPRPAGSLRSTSGVGQCHNAPRSVSLLPWASSPYAVLGELHATPQTGRPTYSYNQVLIFVLGASSPYGSFGELYATPQSGRPTYSYNQVPFRFPANMVRW